MRPPRAYRRRSLSHALNAMSSGDGKRRRVLSPEERVLWTTVTRSIAPLRESAVGDEESPSTVETKRVAVSVANPASRKPALTESKAPPLAQLGRRMKQRVARGKEKIDGRLDLHGLTQSEAHATLLRFLRTASSREARLVLVITGKGAPCGRRRTGRSQTTGAAMAWFAGISRIDYRFRRRARRPWRRGRALRQGATKQTLLSQATPVRG